MFVYWSIYENNEEVSIHNLPNPYLPVIKIIERAKTIYTQNGQFQIGNITFNNFEKYKSFVMPSLDEDFLNFIDKKIHKSMRNIPNQEKTNQLWVEFQSKGL